MVLSMLLALATCPALLGTAEAIRQGQSKDRREEHRARRCNLIITCVRSCSRSREIDSRQVVLKDNKLYIDTGTATEPNGETSPLQAAQFGHPFAGYYLPYPEEKYEGLVSTITEEPPILNWIYVDKDTYEVKYGVRVQAQPNITGPFDCTRQDRRVSLEGWEGFVAVEEDSGLWALYFDRDDNGLKGKVKPSMRVLEVELTRKEKRVPKPKMSTLEIHKTATSVIKSNLPLGQETMGKEGSSISQTSAEMPEKMPLSPLKSSLPNISVQMERPSFSSPTEENEKSAMNEANQKLAEPPDEQEKGASCSPSSNTEAKKSTSSECGVANRLGATSMQGSSLPDSKLESKHLPIRSIRSSLPNGFNGMGNRKPLITASDTASLAEASSRRTNSELPDAPNGRDGEENHSSWSGARSKEKVPTNGTLLSVPNGLQGTRKRRWSHI